jgi:hypothetical protein
MMVSMMSMILLVEGEPYINEGKSGLREKIG